MADKITVTKADMQKMLATDKTELDSALRDLQTEVKSTQNTDPIKFSKIIKQELENTLSTSQSQIQEINHKLNETRNNLQVYGVNLASQLPPAVPGEIID